MNQLPKIIFVYPFKSSFIRKDEELLKLKFNVISLFFQPIPKYRTPIVMLIQVFQLLKHIKGCRGIVCQFAGFHTFFPVIIGRIFDVKISIILLGAECHNYPNIQHGNYRKKLLRMFTGFTFQFANQLLPIDQSLVKFNNNYDKTEPKDQGFLGLFPNLKTKYQVIPHGFNDSQFILSEVSAKPKTFITAASSIAPPVFQRKGIDLILEAAKELPDCHFTILCKNNYLNPDDLPINVKLLEAVPYEKLPQVLASHKYYIQASIAEGLPNALCEAMLCGCIPIGSNVFAIPYIIDNTGIIINERSSDALVLGIKNLINNDEFSAEKSRSRIQELFPISAREQLLAEAIV